MKRVTFKAAKALKGAGYPQGITRDVYVVKTCIEYPVGVCISSSVSLPQDYIADIPFAMEAWLWLWREKGIKISHRIGVNITGIEDNDAIDGLFEDPEEAIIAAIGHLVDNNLIK